MELSGKYYDGQSSKSRPAVLYIEDNSVKLQIEDEIVSWEFKFISLKNLGNTSLVINYSKDELDQVFEAYYRDEQELKNVRQKLSFLSRDTTSKIFGYGNKAIGIIATVSLSFVLLFYFYIIPPLAEGIARIAPLEFENVLGISLSNAISEEMNIDELRSIELQKFYNTLAHKSNYKYTFKVVNEDVVNAFAIPGGHIYVFSGLLDKITTYEQLSALLYHEIGHIELRHTLRNLFRTLSRSLFISLVTSDLSGVSAAVLDNMNTLYTLSYSKELETAADEYSSLQMKENKMDLKGFVELFKLLKKENDLEIPEILSTHPLTEDRIKFGDNQLKNQVNYISKINCINQFNKIQQYMHSSNDTTEISELE